MEILQPQLSIYVQSAQDLIPRHVHSYSTEQAFHWNSATSDRKPKKLIFYVIWRLKLFWLTCLKDEEMNGLNYLTQSETTLGFWFWGGLIALDCLFLFLFSFLKSKIPGEWTKAPGPPSYNAVTAQCRQARLDPVPPPLLSISLTGSDLEFVIDINNPNITSYLFWFTWINFSSNCVWFKQRILLINNYIYNVLNRMTNFLKDKN